MKMNIKKLSASLFLFSILATGCGSATNSIDPLTLCEGDAAIPQLDAIMATSGVYSSLVSGFSSTTQYWIFGTSASAGNYFAPAKGQVTEVGTETLTNNATVSYVKIVHSCRMATKLYGMQLVNVRAGDSVVSGQIIGTYVTSGYAAFQVLFDGVPRCPLSFMSQTFRTNLSSFYGSTICQ